MNKHGQRNHSKLISCSEVLLPRNTDILKRYHAVQIKENMGHLKSVHI
jgi:hypothetical protein